MFSGIFVERDICAFVSDHGKNASDFPLDTG